MRVDYRKKWLVMAATATGIFLSTIDGSIVNIALDTLVQALKQPLAVIEWVVLAYLLVNATLMLSIGRFADMVGKKKIYLFGMMTFTLGSLFCGLSPNVSLLITSRVIQAIGAAMMMAVGMAITTEAFPPAERGKALGINGIFVSIGVITGPTVGGIILQYLPWHWLFFVNLPIGVIGIIFTILFVPDIRPDKQETFDFLGAGLLFICMVSFLLALSFIQINGFGDWIIYVLFVISVVTAVLFIRTERRVAEPMVDLQLFKNRLFSVNIGTALLAFIASAGITLLIPLYLQDVMGFDTQKTGLWMVISPIAMALVAPISGMLSDKIGSRLLTTIGLSVALAGYIVLTTFTANTSMLVYSITFILTGAGTGFFQSPNNSAVMGSSPKERLGVASGLLSLTRVLGQTAGVSILGTIWASNVIHFAGSFQGADATQAPKAAQVAGLHVASLSIVGIISVAVFFSAWALISVSRTKRADEPEV